MTTLTIEQANAIDDAVRDLESFLRMNLRKDWTEFPPYVEANVRGILERLVENPRYRVNETGSPSVSPVGHRIGEIPAAPKARTSDPATSKRASLENLPRRRNQHRKIIILLAEKFHASFSAEQIHRYLDMRLNSVSTRLSELERAGWVEVIPESRHSKRQQYRISTRGLHRYRLGIRQEAVK